MRRWRARAAAAFREGEDATGGNTYRALTGRTPSGPVTFARVSTDDRHGRIATYDGQGRFTDDALRTFGNRAVVEGPACSG